MKKKNEDDPDFLGGLGGMLPADVLKMLNELLERMQQLGHTNQGSKIEIVYVAAGAQYVNHIDTQVFGERKPQEAVQDSNVKDTPTSLPPELSTDKAMALWHKAQRAGYVDNNYQPLISRTQSAILAFEMAKRLGIRYKWKVFETLWNRRNMYRDYHDAINQYQSLNFRDSIKDLFR